MTVANYPLSKQNTITLVTLRNGKLFELFNMLVLESQLDLVVVACPRTVALGIDRSQFEQDRWDPIRMWMRRLGQRPP